MITDRKKYLLDAICVFDIDGVLSVYDYSYKNHNACNTKNWDNNSELISEVYQKARCPKAIVEFVNSRQSKFNYVCSIARSEEERVQKMNFVVHNYPNISISNIYFVEDYKQKLIVLNNIKTKIEFLMTKMYSYDNNIVLIDDSPEVLNYIQDNSGFATLHISSFLD